MITVEFQARVENGVIVVPEEYRQDLADASTVKVVVSKRTQKSSTHPDLIDYLTENPIPVQGFLTRNEAHDRNL
jgi:hypothetical protein